MSTRWKTLKRLYLPVLLATFAGATAMLLLYTPVEATMGPVQKIFYVHLPAAINAFLACLVCFLGGVGFLWQRKMKWDDLSAAAAKVAALMCTVVLVTGVIWGRAAWGQWWTWSPRLTFSLLLWLLYVVYLIVRPSIESRERRAMISAVYAVAAFLDVPLVYLSVRLMPDIHPVSVEMDPAMKITLAVWFVPMSLLTVGLIAVFLAAATRRRLKRQQRREEASWSLATPREQGLRPGEDQVLQVARSGQP
ncbi:MAG TPA: cytochrome c biogenesis protein CcsA [Phycisphaerae bacterium]|nr:cytochrome c biogenesis protein CcsA [Phycisphaerae bacterium]